MPHLLFMTLLPIFLSFVAVLWCVEFHQRHVWSWFGTIHLKNSGFIRRKGLLFLQNPLEANSASRGVRPPWFLPLLWQTIYRLSAVQAHFRYPLIIEDHDHSGYFSVMRWYFTVFLWILEFLHFPSLNSVLLHCSLSLREGAWMSCLGLIGPYSQHLKQPCVSTLGLIHSEGKFFD